jgi:hypothetical protein
MPTRVPLHEIRAEFAELDDPVDRTTYLIEIGRTLPPLDEALKTEENRVLGRRPACGWFRRSGGRPRSWSLSPTATPRSSRD